MRRLIGTAAAALAAFSLAMAQENEGADAPADDLVAAADDEAPPQADLFARDSYKTTPIVCPFKGRVKYKPGEISCGLLTVPENREKADSRDIQLHYVKIHARKPDDWDADEKGEWSARDDSIVYLTGGPGAHATGYVERFKDHGVRDFRNLYILEQRGIGFSEDFCPLYGNFDPAAGNTPDYAEYQRAGIKAMEACFAAASARGVDLSAYNTIENARDVKALRRALGYETWNVWGISYGSILGQAYLREDEAAIRAAVIDAIVPIEPGARFQRIGVWYQRDLDLLEAACEADEACAAAFPDFVERYKAAIGKVIDNGPIEIDAIDTELFPAGKAWIFHDIIAGAPFVQLYEQDNYPTLPAFIAGLTDIVENEDYESFRLITAGGMGGPGGFSISPGMYNAIACNDNWVGYLRETLEQDRAEHPVLSAMQGDPAMIDDMAAICLKYGMAPRPAEQYAPLVTDIRTLIVEGEMDPITPPPLAEMILPGFSNGTYVEFAYAGHGPSRSVDCAGEFLTKFYDDPHGELDTSCPESMAPPSFSGPLYATRGLTRLAAAMAEDEKKAALPALWFGGAALILLLAAAIFTLAPIANLVNRGIVISTGGARPLAWATALAGAVSAGGLAWTVYATYEASEFALLIGLLPMARWFVYAGLAAGLMGFFVLLLAIKARARISLPLGTLFGLALTGLAAVALAAFLLASGFVLF